MGLYSNEFLFNVEKTKKISYINHRNMFIGYIALSRKLYKQDNWKSNTVKIMNSIDFSIENSIWKDIRINDNILNKTSRKELYKLFKEV